jgi:cyclopropane fatty-acyl-phospholipid synthase-like methyltransferase
MADDRLYPFWGDFEEALRTGEPQNEAKRVGADLFDEIYDDPERMRAFLEAMAAAQGGAFIALAEKFDFSSHNTLCDIGGALAALSIEIARRHPHLRCISADLPIVDPLARDVIEQAGLSDRVVTKVLDFWRDPFPAADVITMGNILHDWNLEEKKVLIGKAHQALNDGGALVIVENIIDDERRSNAFGLLMSLNMLIETRGGFDFTGADFASWTREAGFSSSTVIPLAGPTSAAVAYK